MPASIAVLTIAAAGHVNPNLPLAAELVRRGHRVTYVVGAPYAERVERATGAHVVGHPSTLPQGDTAWPEGPVAGLRLMWEEARRELPAVHAALAAADTELVLHDITGVSGRPLARMLGVDAVQLSPSIVAWDTWAQDTGGGLPAMPGGTELLAEIGDWMAGLGFSDVGAADALGGVGQDQLVLIPRAMQPHADRVSPRARFVGPLLPPRPGEDAWRPPASGRPVLLCSLGSAYTEQPAFWRACLEAFAQPDDPWHVVLAHGHRVQPEELGPLAGSPHVELHAFAPQLAILEQATAFVTHAGSGATSEALWTGTPMVCVPQAVDQPMNAARVAELGVGAVLEPERATAAELRRTLAGLLADPSTRPRATALREQTRASGGVAHAADAVEQLLP